MNIESALDEVFQEVFNDSAIHVTEATTADDVDGWDSFTYINLISAIELHFGIEFSQNEVLNFENVSELMASIREKLS